MIKVGLVGEDPNDTSSIKNLLSRKYKDNGKIQFIPLIQRVKGYQLDNTKTKKSLKVEFADKKCSFVVYIRDLDGLNSETAKVQKCKDWFKKLDAETNKKGVLLLNIWELEALIFADIETFNRIYKTHQKPGGDPTFIKEPKERLMEITRKSAKPYKESHCPGIFEKLDIKKVEKCSCFKEFITELDSRLKPQKKKPKAKH